MTMAPSHDEWLGWIIDAAADIASRKYQEEAWFPGGQRRSSPDEVYLTLIEDRLFDKFFDKYGSTFSELQTQSWEKLRRLLEGYYDKLPKYPDPRTVLNDPEWEDVRQAAKEFVKAFKAHGSEYKEI